MRARKARECSPNKKLKSNARNTVRNTGLGVFPPSPQQPSLHTARGCEGMMVDEEECGPAKRDISIEHKADVDIDMDDEGDVSMVKATTKIESTATTRPIKTKPRLERKVSMGVIDAMTYRRPSKRRSREQFPANRVRRSGVEFLVQCGVGA